jgi:sulfur carrier protein
MSATITLNGKGREWRDMNVRELLTDAGIEPGKGGLAVAVNAAVVPRAAWEKTRIRAGDKIEIVRIVRGG